MTGAGTAVLVHGLWHGAWAWDEVGEALEARGVESHAVHLPLTTLAGDVEATRAVLDGLAGPAILVGHSYGGAVITEAGTHPAVRRLLYIAAFQLDADESVSRLLPGQEHPPTRLPEALVISEDEVSLDPDLGPHLLYNGVPPDRAAASAARLRPSGRRLFGARPSEIAWRHRPSTYVVCMQDEVVHPSMQRAMATRATDAVEWDCGHCPNAASPERVADLVAERLSRWCRT